MFSPRKIMTWLVNNVKGMRLSRVKTFYCVVLAAMMRCGVGVLALGRVMPGRTSAKHKIKRVWRFLRKSSVEAWAVHEALYMSSSPKRGPVIILVAWTDLASYQCLVFALARDGRAVPFYSKTITVSCGQGGKVTQQSPVS